MVAMVVAVPVSVGVAVSVANVTNEALIGAGAAIVADGVSLSATTPDRKIAAPVLAAPVVTTHTDATTDNPFAKDSIFLGLDSGLTTGDHVAYFSDGHRAIGGLDSDPTGQLYSLTVPSLATLT
jgi:phosphohistidine swiveling domain-containing protein